MQSNPPDVSSQPGNRSAANNLRLFTRYPHPGEAKTRLIPEIGEQDAADLQRRMTELITRRMSGLSSSRIRLTVSFSDASRKKMEQWLGSISDRLHFSPQAGADLGERMRNDVRKSFRNGHQRTIIIGTDCPDVTTGTIEKGFRILRNNDAVIGPALDGGYYLIGLSTVEEQLFSGIDWGSGSVFEQTMQQARKTNLRIKTLEQLRDIDRPKDLNHLEHVDLPE